MLPARCSRRVVSFESMEARRLFATGLLSDAVGLSATESVNVDGTSYFFADDGVIGRELWKSDGTALGTVLVKDLTPGADGTQVYAFFHTGGRAVIITVGGNQSAEGQQFAVWSSDGTAAGTVKLAEFSRSWITAVQAGDRVAFIVNRSNAATSDLRDAYVYFTDGTQAGTIAVRSFIASPESPGIPTKDYGLDSLHAAGNQIVFGIGSAEIWASDGTAGGTVDLTPLISTVTGRPWVTGVSLYNMEEFEDKVLIPTESGFGSKLWITDGTLAGTRSLPFNVGRVEQSKVIGHTYFFESLTNAQSTWVRTLYAMDLDSGVITQLHAEDRGDVHAFNLSETGGVLLFSITNNTTGHIDLWSSDGTVAGTVKLTSIAQRALIHPAVYIDGIAYFVVTFGGYQPGIDPEQADFPGRIGSRLGMSIVNSSDPAHIQLWRSDGTVDGTGVVRSLFDGDAQGKQVLATLSTGNGKLLIRTEIATGIKKGAPWSDQGLTTLWDDTLAYEPGELNIARYGAIARVVNGVLRLNGSVGPDNFRVYRLVSDPSQLVVEYNGNKRVFAFSTIRRIVADLQDGNDKLDIVEYEGGEIRLWTSILGGDGADTIFTGTGRDTVIGGSGPDMIRSRGNADVVIGGGGRDRITGGEGDDVIAGGTGHDSVIAGTGHDVLFGQNAVERVFGRLWDDGDTLEDLVLQSF